MRKSGLRLDGYPNYIAPYNIDKLSRRHHPLGNFPFYPKNTEPQTYFEELLASERYKQLVDEFCRIHTLTDAQGNNQFIHLPKPGYEMMAHCHQLIMGMMEAEIGLYRQLERIAEDTVRSYYNLGKDEVLFDIEILDPRTGQKPANFFNFNKGEEETIVEDPAYTEDLRVEIMRRRLTNALIQGASLKGHFLFHMASERLEQLKPGLTDLYNRSMISNDLNYYYIDDVLAGKASEREVQVSMVQVDFSGKVPVIRVKAMTFTTLMHEMVKGVLEVLTSVGIPKDPTVAQKVIDLCDTVLNEFWDIRLGPRMWEMFFSLIEPDDYDLIKHIIIGVNQLETQDYLDFMKAVFEQHNVAKLIIQSIVRTKREQIANYAVEMASEPTEPEPKNDNDLPEIDWGGLF